LDQVLADQNQRDRRDESRDCGPLVKAEDAVEVSTDGLSLEQVVDRLETLVRRRVNRTCNDH
jgi:cytidylate kinase